MPLAEDLQRAHMRTGNGKARQTRMAIRRWDPEGEAGVCVRVESWCHRRRVDVARGPED